MSAIDRITVNPDICGGRPCVRGLRIRVKDVLDLLAAGASREESLADYPYLASAADHDIRTYAVNVGAVIITKDEDVVVRKMLENGPAVVWVRIGNTRRAELLRRLETHFASILNALERGETLVEVV